VSDPENKDSKVYMLEDMVFGDNLKQISFRIDRLLQNDPIFGSSYLPLLNFESAATQLQYLRTFGL
jgi:hypothetical protein